MHRTRKRSRPLAAAPGRLPGSHPPGVLLASALSLVALVSLWARPAKACSPLPPSDWGFSGANVWDGEEGVPRDLVLRLELSRDVDGSGTGLESDFDPEAFVMTCDGSPVQGVWSTPAPDRLWRNPSLRQQQGFWSSRVGCTRCESGVTVLQASFEPDAELPPEAACEVTLLEAGAPVGWGVAGPNTYPWVFLSFTTGAESAPDALAPGEPEARLLLYREEQQGCDPGPLQGSCLTCVTQETATRLGVVFSYPAPTPEARPLLVHLYRADTAEGLAAATPTTFWLANTTTEAPPELAVDLGAEGDPVACAQVVLEDREGRRTAPSAPLCVDPATMPWPDSSGCGCSEAPPGWTTPPILGALALLLLLVHRRRHRSRRRDAGHRLDA